MSSIVKESLPLISMIVVVCNMRREAPRTLYTLSPGYQNISPDLYEVIVVENGSTDPLGREAVESISSNFRYIDVNTEKPSPAPALNYAVAKLAKGQLLGFMSVGVSLLSPGVLQYAIRASRCYDQPIVSTLGFHLGSKVQPTAARRGYTQQKEDELLASINWREDGYELFRISTFAGSSGNGWIAPLGESDCVFLPRASFDALEGFDEAFVSPGGGMVNLDFYRRACHLPGSQLVVLLGEGSFRQFYGGLATEAPARNGWRAKLASIWNERFGNGPTSSTVESEYRQIRGQPFRADWRPCDFMGHLSPSLHPKLRESIKSLNKVRVPPDQMRRASWAQRSILILGMHRSGTSMLTGSLQEAGLALGDVVTRAAHNVKGNREHRDIMSMQEDLLQCNGGAWDAPPETVKWQLNHKARRNQFVSHFKNEKIWGFKDPRTLLTIEGWLDVLPETEFVGIFRHPVHVAQSLYRRNNMPLREGLKLWQIYNQRLVELHERHGFPLLEFQDDPAALQASLQRLIVDLDLPFQGRPVTFFENQLRQTCRVEMPLPKDIQKLYHELQNRVREDSARGDRAA